MYWGWARVFFLILCTLVYLWRVQDTAALQWHWLRVPGWITFFDHKVNKHLVNYPLSNFLDTWRACILACKRPEVQWDSAVLPGGTVELQRALRDLLRYEQLPETLWHGWKKLGAALFILLEGSMVSLQRWGHWHSLVQPRRYSNGPPAWRLPDKLQLPFPVATDLMQPVSALTRRRWSYRNQQIRRQVACLRPLTTTIQYPPLRKQWLPLLQLVTLGVPMWALSLAPGLQALQRLRQHRLSLVMAALAFWTAVQPPPDPKAPLGSPPKRPVHGVATRRDAASHHGYELTAPRRGIAYAQWRPLWLCEALPTPMPLVPSDTAGSPVSHSPICGKSAERVDERSVYVVAGSSGVDGEPPTGFPTDVDMQPTDSAELMHCPGPSSCTAQGHAQHLDPPSPLELVHQLLH